jgi:predicted O-methyltransferase YrrM
MMSNSFRSLLRELEAFGATNDARAVARQEQMLNITPETGELLAILVQAARASRVLEIGTSNGYSTLWLAEAAKSIAGTVCTIEVSEPKSQLARRNFERSGLSSWIRQETTERGQFLRQQTASSFDLLFLDADRERYFDWWPQVQRVLAPGGLLIADNAVSHAAEMERFCRQVQATPGWRSLVIPVGNGEFVALKPIRDGADFKRAANARPSHYLSIGRGKVRLATAAWTAGGSNRKSHERRPGSTSGAAPGPYIAV